LTLITIFADAITLPLSAPLAARFLLSCYAFFRRRRRHIFSFQIAPLAFAISLFPSHTPFSISLFISYAGRIFSPPLFRRRAGYAFAIFAAAAALSHASRFIASRLPAFALRHFFADASFAIFFLHAMTRHFRQIRHAADTLPVFATPPLLIFAAYY
jgi:hypothetical protein